jgi:hypothetical protein
LPCIVPPFAILVPLVDNRPDDVANDLECPLRGAPKRLGLLAHGHDLHLRLAALGDGDGLAAFGNLVDQGETARLEGGRIDLAFHGRNPM